MLKERVSRLRYPTYCAFALGLAGLIALIALGSVLWLSLQPQQVATQSAATQSVATQSGAGQPKTPPGNQGNSLLYISTSVAAGLAGHYEDTLTMFRTSDGKELWQFHTSGSISNGFERPDGAIRAGTAVQVVNGVVYFVVDSNQQNSSGTSLHQLMALRASDGKVLWQQSLQTGIVGLLIVSNGIVCIESTPKAYTYSNDTLMLAGYRADTGALAWQRQWNSIPGKPYGSVFLSSLDGLLYFLATPPGAPTQALNSQVVAVEVADGKTRWSSNVQQVDFLNTFPLLSDQGLVVFMVGSKTASPLGIPNESLVGFDENSGMVRWHYHLPGILDGSFSHLDPLPFNAYGVQEENGIFYFPTITEHACCPSTITSFSVTALRIADGQQLWHNALVQGGVMLLDTTLSQGLYYLAYDTITGGGQQTDTTGTVVAALQTSNGALRWEDHPAKNQGYMSLTTAQDGMPALVYGDTISALQPQDGSMRWQQTITTGEHLIFLRSAGGKLVASFQDTNADGGAGLDHLCTLETATGQKLWCQTFNTQLSWVELGP